MKVTILNIAKACFFLMLVYPAVCLGGDRVFYNGAFWLQNRTISQLEGFDVIRLSSNVLNRARIDSITRIEKKKLMIGLAEHHMLLTHPTWPGDILADSSQVGNPIRTFKDSLASWSDNDDKSPVLASDAIAHVFYNNEWPYKAIVEAAISAEKISASDTTSVWTPKAVSGLHAQIIHKYKSLLKEFYPNAKLWVFGSAHEVRGDDLNYEYRRHSIDWEVLSVGPNAPDFFCLGTLISAHPSHLQGALDTALQDIRDTAPLLDRTLIAPSFGTANLLSTEQEWIDTRNTYQNNWENFKTFIDTVKALADSANNNISSPSLWYQLYYLDRTDHQHIGTPEVPPGSGRYTRPPPSANNFVKRFRDIPYADGYDFPARFWEREATNWDWSRSVNQWEAEMVANYLKATGYDVPGRQITSNTTWSNEIVLLGDVEVISGVTLTIQPGTRIFLRPNTDVYETGWDAQKIEIVIKQGGTLTANGTLNSPITLQSSLNIDSYDSPGKDDWGGIRNEGGTLTLQHCVISDAEVGVEVTSYQGKTTISETDLSANHFGMKVHAGASSTQLELTNIGLYQSLKGIIAGLYGTGHVQLTNATIADNYQGVEFVEDGDSPSMQLKNTIVAFNENGIYTAGTNFSSPALTLRYSDVFGAPPTGADFQGVYTAMPTVGSTGNVSVDPKFVAHASDTSEENDYHLQASSPLIDAGDPSMTEADNSTINMGRYGGTTEYTSVSSGDGTSSTKPAVLKTEEAPLVFSLSQNAPNPFNPETIISYSLPQSEQVKLVIYNVLGQEIRTLVNAFKPAGRYRVVWNSKDDFGRSVSSGIYFYQITAGEFLDTRKMLILK